MVSPPPGHLTCDSSLGGRSQMCLRLKVFISFFLVCFCGRNPVPRPQPALWRVTQWDGGGKPVIPAGGGDLMSGDLGTLGWFAFSPFHYKQGDAFATMCFCLFVPP